MKNCVDIKVQRVLEDMKIILGDYNNPLLYSDNITVSLHVNQKSEIQVLFNNVMVIPDISKGVIPCWCNWVIKANKQEAYGKVILDLQDKIEDIKTRIKSEEERAIEENIKKIGV